jgi:hypothetical protein
MTKAAGTALSNSTTETSLAQKVFSADELQIGKIYHFEAGVRVTAQNSTDTFAIGVRFGTNATPASNTACGATTAVDAAVGDIAVVRGSIHVHSATRAVMLLTMSDVDAEGTMAVEQYMEILTIATGTPYYLDITGTWSVANAGNSAQAEAFSVLEMV